MQSTITWISNLPWKGIRAVALAFFATRLVLAAVIYVSMVELPVREGQGLWRSMPGNLLIDGLVRWDSGFYLDIARMGYTGFPTPSATVFLPVYPALVWLASQLTGELVVAGLLVSNLAFLAALGFLYAFARLEYDEDTASRAVFYLAASPTAFFCSAYYTESSFLLFVLAAFYFARKQNWLLAGLSGMLAAVTRNTGILIAPYLALEGFWLNGGKWLAAPFGWHAQWALFKYSLLTWIKTWRALLAAALSTVGLAVYMLYLKVTFNDPLAFIYQHTNWQRNFSLNFMRLLYHDLRRMVNIQGDLWAGSMLDINALQDVVAAALFGILVLLVLWKMRPSLAFYTLATFAMPLLTGRFYSMRRFVLMLIPCFLLLALCGKRPWVDRLILIIFLPLQAYLAILFAHWIFAG